MSDLLKSLCKFGLSPNEAKAYLTLVMHGSLSAKKVSLLANIPFSKVYSILNGLVQKGWVYKLQEGSTIVFKPKPPREAIMEAKHKIILELDSNADTIITNLQPIFESRLSAEKPDIWLIYGENNVREKLIDMIRYTNEELLLALHIRLKGIIPIIEALKKRGIKVRVLTVKSLVHSFKLIKECVRVRDSMFGGGAISDTREAVIILGAGKDIIAIWSNHMELIYLARHYFESLWLSAEEI